MPQSTGPVGPPLSFSNAFWGTSFHLIEIQAILTPDAGKDDAGVTPLLDRMQNAKTTCGETSHLPTTLTQILRILQTNSNPSTTLAQALRTNTRASSSLYVANPSVLEKRVPFEQVWMLSEGRWNRWASSTN